MEIDFVSFDLAKKLKEKGFKQKCLAYYDVEDNVGLLYNTQYTDEALPCQYTDLLQCHNTGEAETQPDDSGYCVDAPTISQVLKWLREKGIFIEIHTHATFATKNKVAYWCRICRNSNGVRIKQIDELEASYADYEKAAMGGIEYCLDKLIKL